MLSQFIYMYLNTNKCKCSFTVNEPVSKEQWNSLTHTGVVNVIYTFCGESDALIVPSGFYPNPRSAMEHNRSPLVLSWPYCLIVICTNILFSWFSFAVSLYYCFVDFKHNSCLIYVFVCCLCACILTVSVPLHTSANDNKLAYLSFLISHLECKRSTTTRWHSKLVIEIWKAMNELGWWLCFVPRDICLLYLCMSSIVQQHILKHFCEVLNYLKTQVE